MFYTYILKSGKDGKLYLGSTKDLRKRFIEHNSGLVKSTMYRRPLKIVYYEAYLSEHEARKRESNLKLRARALRQLLIRIKESISF